MRLREPDPETCCYCATVTRGGIYVRGPVEEARYCPSRWQSGHDNLEIPDDEIPELTPEQLARAKPHWQFMVARAFVRWVARLTRCDWEVNPFAMGGGEEQCPNPGRLEYFRLKMDGEIRASYRCREHSGMTNEAWESVRGPE